MLLPVSLEAFRGGVEDGGAVRFDLQRGRRVDRPAEALLAPARLAEEGFDPTPIRARWQQHLSGAVNGQYPLWCVLMYQSWRDHWRGAA